MLTSIIDDLNDVPEAVQEDYEQDEESGKYVLKKSVFEDHPGWRKLKGTANEQDRKRREAERRARQFEERLGRLPEDLDLEDVDNDRLDKALAFLRGEWEPENDDNKVDVEAIKAGERKRFEREMERVRTEAEKYKLKLVESAKTRAIDDSMAEAKVAEPYREAVRAMFRERVSVEEDDNGELKPLINGEYGPQDVKSFLKEWTQTEKGQFFTEAPLNMGGGARGGGTSGKVKNPWSKDHWSMAEQARIYNEDPSRARQMAAEHGKKVG